MQRAFIVGCPRSGATLVQAMLARHPAVLTLAGTAFFEHLCGDLAWRWGDRATKPPRHLALGFAQRRARESLRVLGERLPQAHAHVPAWPLSAQACARRFVDLLDAQAQAEGCAAWIEKTPCHLLYIPEIERHVPEARFVHVIRPGEDVLASIADANFRYGDNDALGGGTMLWAQRWNRAAQIHQDCARRSNHHFVFLDELLDDGEREWRRLCRFLDLEPAAQRRGEGEDLSWQRDGLSGLPAKPQRKAEKLFGPVVRDWLRRKLLPYEELRRALPHAGAVVQLVPR